MTQKFFIDRRSGTDRRRKEQRRQLRRDLSYARRQNTDRRNGDSVAGDFYAMHGMEPEDFKAPDNTH